MRRSGMRRSGMRGIGPGRTRAGCIGGQGWLMGRIGRFVEKGYAAHRLSRLVGGMRSVPLWARAKPSYAQRSPGLPIPRSMMVRARVDWSGACGQPDPARFQSWCASASGFRVWLPFRLAGGAVCGLVRVGDDAGAVRGCQVPLPGSGSCPPGVAGACDAGGVLVAGTWDRRG